MSSSLSPAVFLRPSTSRLFQRPHELHHRRKGIQGLTRRSSLLQHRPQVDQGSLHSSLLGHAMPGAEPVRRAALTAAGSRNMCMRSTVLASRTAQRVSTARAMGQRSRTQPISSLAILCSLSIPIDAGLATLASMSAVATSFRHLLLSVV